MNSAATSPAAASPAPVRNTASYPPASSSQPEATMLNSRPVFVRKLASAIALVASRGGK